MEKIEITLKDLYQFLITDCRYGYTRNNHLMPGGAYDHVKAYLPAMSDIDSEKAINTAKQLCEECIEMELIQFADGIDDENGNRKAAFDFIDWLLSFINAHTDKNFGSWKPYNYDIYLANKAKDDEPRYDVYEAEYTGYNKLDDEHEFKLGNKINDEMISKKNLFMFLIKSEPLFNTAKGATYRKYEYKPGYDEHFESHEDYNKQIMTKYVFDEIKKAYIVKRGDC